MKILLTGTPNIGKGKERTETFSVTNTKTCIVLKDSYGNALVSFTPFLNGGSIWLSDFSDIIMDREHWGDKNGKFEMQWKEEQAIANTSTDEIMRWKQDSEDLEKIREAERLKQ